MSSRLRPFKEEDAAGVRELILTVLSKEYPFDRKAYADTDLDRIGEIYGGKRNAFFVAEERGAIVGTIGVKEETGDMALIRRFFVDLKHRKQGCGSALLERALGFCHGTGYRRVCFRCTDRMADAMRLCTHKGFVEAEKLDVSGFAIHRLELAL